MSLLQNSNAISAGGYDVNNSLRFRSSASAYLNRTPASAGNRTTWTWSAWVKRGVLSANQSLLSAGTGSTNFDEISFLAADTLTFSIADSNITRGQITTSAVFRDPSAWYHVVAVLDTTNATAANRMRLYINGTLQTVTINTQIAQNYASGNINNNVQNTIGTRRVTTLDYYLDGYQAEINFIDGQALTPSSFGETDTTTGVWKPKAYTGTYGTNGFYLKFSDIATTSGSNAGLGKDFSGNTNYLTTNNISVTSGTTYDAMTDSPTNTSATVANYCVLNPLDKTASMTLSNGNLDFASAAAGDFAVRGTIFVSSGKWYFEFVQSNNVAVGQIVAVANESQSLTQSNQHTASSNLWGFQFSDGNKANGGLSSYGNAAVAGDVIGVAIDMDNGRIWFSINGTWQASGNPASGTNAAFTNLSGQSVAPYYYEGNSGVSPTGFFNFGQRPFSYTPPTGFNRLNTFNLPTPTILQGNKYMDATLYTGNGSSQTITNAGGFRPDFVWAKRRNGSVAAHALFDSIRGANSALYSNLTNAQDTGWTGQAFTSTGFTVSAAYSGETNANTAAFVQWQWQAGQGSTSSNTSGTITSTVSVNATAGFSIVTYTGTAANATVGHGLGVAPKMVIVKKRSATGSWAVYHIGLTSAAYQVWLDLTSAQLSRPTTWNSTAPTSTVFSIGTDTDVNVNAATFVAYCFAEIAGFSRFGSYTGNGSADGPFVFTNLKARFIMIKRTDSTSNWTILDTAREGYNVDNDPLYPNLSDAEGTTDLADILSNGFKLRSTDTSVNANAGTYIYACFSSNPFKNSTAV